MMARTTTATPMPAEASGAHLGWNLARDVGEVVEYHFMVNALLAGAVVAVMSGIVGWLMVLRGETFAGHTLSVMAFPGSAAAALTGIPAAWGYIAFCGAGALAIGRLPGARRGTWAQESAAVGVFQALALAIGFLLVSVYGGVLGDLDSLLFGDLLGISDAQVLALGGLAIGVLSLLALLGRPLLFASVDAHVAAARGVPVERLSLVFLLVLGLAVAATSQITGPLLVFALLVAPAASAQLLTSSPARGLGLSVVLGVAVAWLGLGLSYFSSYPAGFFIATVAFALYALARTIAALRRSRAVRGRVEDVLEPPPRGVIA
jgi:zinc/manganese transport system permease protein